MNPVQSVLVAILLVIGVGTQLLCSLGLLTMRGAFDRMHYLGPAAVVGGVALCTAAAIAGPLTQVSFKALLLAVLLVVANAVLTHATARAIKRRAAPESEKDQVQQ